MTQEALKLALDWAEAHGEIVFAGGGMSAVNKMNSWVAAIKEALAKEKTLQALHSENERLGLYKDAYAQPKPQIKTTDPFESSRVGDYNRGWNDCLFASGIVKQPEQEPVAWVCEGSSSDEKHAVDYQQEDIDAIPIGTMLYTHPPQRKPLTDGQIYSMVADITDVRSPYLQFAKAIEAAHGIKE